MAHAASNDSAEAHGALQQSQVTPAYVLLDSEIQPISTIGLAQRARLAARPIRSLRPLWPRELSMSLAVVYIVAPTKPGARDKRIRSFLRWSAAVDTAGADPKLAGRQTRRHLNTAFLSTQEALAAHYRLLEVGDDEVTATLGADRCHLPLAELRYVSWPSSRQWLAPAHVQPVLDYLEAQQGSGALSIMVERMADLDPTGEPDLRLSIAALGQATDETALRLLTDEFRGCGVLATDRAESRDIPALQQFQATTADERAYISRALVQPWAPRQQSSTDVTLTSAEAGLLLPLPMPLYSR